MKSYIRVGGCLIDLYKMEALSGKRILAFKRMFLIPYDNGRVGCGVTMRTSTLAKGVHVGDIEERDEQCLLSR